MLLYNNATLFKYLLYIKEQTLGLESTKQSGWLIILEGETIDEDTT